MGNSIISQEMYAYTLVRDDVYMDYRVDRIDSDLQSRCNCNDYDVAGLFAYIPSTTGISTLVRG